jgi:oligoendopeptidase F
MNYQPTVLDHVFTLAHEAGHSMHSYYSAKTQPFVYYDYVIFVAEVASTFNEQLLSRHLMERAKSDEERAYLVNRDIDAIRGTIIRQTMFAEFEKVIHETAEAGEPLTVEAFKNIYGELLKAYFGPDFTIDAELSLECFRIPHFYRAFYVYKYATGLSAAIALSDRVLSGGPKELSDYLSFLKGGCSKDPLDLLKDAGVDMTTPAPVAAALDRFESLVNDLDELLYKNRVGEAFCRAAKRVHGAAARQEPCPPTAHYGLRVMNSVSSTPIISPPASIASSGSGAYCASKSSRP